MPALPISDYIELTYFGEKFSLDAFKIHHRIPASLEGIEPLLLDNPLPPRVNGQPYNPDPDLFRLSLLGNNKNPLRVNYQWYYKMKINNLLPNYFVFQRTNFQNE